MFQDGVGAKRDYKQALDWYRKAADQDLGQAEKQVG
jgi:TPR repeat protein